MSTPEIAAEWVTTEQIARHLGVDKGTIWRLVNEHGMPSVKLSPGKSGQRRFKVAEVERWLRDRGEQPT